MTSADAGLKRLRKNVALHWPGGTLTVEATVLVPAFSAPPISESRRPKSATLAEVTALLAIAGFG